MSTERSRTLERATGFVTRHPKLVIGAWLLLAAMTNLAWPQLGTVIENHAPSPFPVDSPSFRVYDDMATAFDERGARNSVTIAMSGPDGFSRQAQSAYTALVDRLHKNTAAVSYVTDLVHDERTRKQALSGDGKAWILTVGLNGDLGSPSGVRNVLEVRRTVDQALAGTSLRAYVTGPPATLADSMEQARSDLTRITLVTGALIALVLLIVYRSVLVAALPLITVGIAIAVSRGIVAGLGMHGMPIAGSTEALMVAILIGAGVDYAVFLISRYHESLQDGDHTDAAVVTAMATMGRVIVASGVTVAAASATMIVARLGAFSATGPALTIAVLIGMVTSLTVLPALLTLTGRRGWAAPKPDRTQRYWAGIGVLVIRRPWRMIVASTALLTVLAGLSTLMTVGLDDRKGMPESLESNRGYRLLSQHFPQDALVPQFLLVQSDKDLRTSQGLADLDQLASRVAQIPGVSAVRGITRPDGTKLTQATLAWQLGQLSDQIDAKKAASEKDRSMMEQLVAATDLLSQVTNEFRPGEIDRLLAAAPGMLSGARQADAELRKYEGLIDRLGNVARLLDQADAFSGGFEKNVARIGSVMDKAAPLMQALNAFGPCDSMPECTQLKAQVHEADELRTAGFLTEIVALHRSFSAATGGRSMVQVVADAKAAIAAMRANTGLLSPDLDAKVAGVTQLYEKLNQLGLADGQKVHEMAAQTRQSFDGLTEAAAFLQTMSHAASTPSASGFYLPSATFDSPDFATAARLFVSPDGKTARYIVQSGIDPYSPAAIALSKRISETGAAATPNTSLDGAHVGLAGMPSMNADLQQYYQRDFHMIAILTFAIVFLVLAVLLRAIVAPIYLLATVMLTYLSALGAGVLVFQVLLGQPLYWYVPAMTFILLVAVGADYNMLLVSRLREETGTNVRTGVIRTVARTGSVITSAGMIFAMSMFGMMASTVTSMMQMGFVIGLGLLLDTFVVRTVTVPAIATVLGAASWWPSKPTR